MLPQQKVDWNVWETRLSEAGFSDQQTEVIKLMMIETTVSRDQLDGVLTNLSQKLEAWVESHWMANRDEIHQVETRLCNKVKTVETRLKSEIGSLEDRLGKQVGSLEDRLGKQVGSLEDRLVKQGSDLAMKLDSLPNQIGASFDQRLHDRVEASTNKVRAEFFGNKLDSRWRMIGFTATITGIVFSVIFALMRYVPWDTLFS